MFDDARGKYTCYHVITGKKEFIFRTELEAVNFMLDIGGKRLPMKIWDHNHMPEVYTTEEAVEEYNKSL